MRFRTLCFVVCIGMSGLSKAQDPRLSQVWTTPVHVNPALSGRFDGMGRFGSLFSFQKSNPVPSKDSSVNVPHQNFYIDFKFGKYRHIGDEEQYALNKLKGSAKPAVEAKDETGLKRMNLGFWSAALNYYRYGDNSNPLKAEFVSATLARHFYAKRNKYFGFGVQAAYARGDLDENRGLGYIREISGNGFRYIKGVQGNRVNTNDYLDFNVGGYYGMATEPVSFELGFAMYHLFYPKNAIVDKDDESKLRHRVSAHSLLRLKMNDNWGMVQRNIYWQEGLYLRSRVYNGDSSQITCFYSGAEFYKTNPKSVYNLNFGLYTRSFQTIMPFVNINLGRVANLRYSYEFPFNSRRFPGVNSKRSEIVLLLTYKRYTPPGIRFSRKVNYW